VFGVVGHECSSGRNVPRNTGERRLEDALKALASALRVAQGSWMLIGGIAVIARARVVRKASSKRSTVTPSRASTPKKRPPRASRKKK
jgi:hypothetical protein